MKRLLIGISAGALAMASVAVAAETQMGPGAHVLTREEAKAHAEEAFAKLDLNHDGKLDAADRAARWGMMFDKIDTNHDGTISRDEFVAAHAKMGPGGMGHGEMGGEHRDGPPPPGHEWREGHEGGPGHGGRMGEHMRGPMGGRMAAAKMGMLMLILREADPAHTGSVTKDAFVGAALKLFDKADTNHDGKVTPEERRAARVAFRQEMGKRMHERMEHDGHMGGMKMGDMPPPPPPPSK